MTIEEAKKWGWKVYRADQSQFNVKRHEVIWCIENPRGQVANISAHTKNTEQDLWEHAERNHFGKLPVPDPVDELVCVLSEITTDPDQWQEIIDNPNRYGPDEPDGDA